MTTAGKDNLRRDESQERSRLISDVSYEVVIDLTKGEVRFPSETRVRFACNEPGASTFIDLDAVEVLEATLNGKSLDVSETPDGRIALGGLAAANDLRIIATCEYSRTGTGLHRLVDPVDKSTYTYTQFEPFDAHRVFACFDQPDIKATFTFAVDVPDEWVVISNMRPSSRPAEGRGGRWTFPATPVMSSYLGAICAGPYQGVFDKADLRGGIVELGWWVRKSLAKYLDSEELFDVTKRGFAFFEDAFDYPYMLDSYDQVFCPEYKFGAMENLGCVTYSERMIFRSKVTEFERENRAEVILHEMSHMWFGDLVTMKWWNDLWLNESFATYVSYLAKERATRFTNSWVTFASGEKNWAYLQDQLPTTHPIVAEIPDVEATHLNFDGITYAKGASVLKQLVAWVGEEPFFRGLRRYFQDHQWKNTELPDFLAPLAAASGRDLVSWSKLWLETAGVNSIKVDGSTVIQEAPADHPRIRPHRMAIGLFDAGADGLTLRRSIELDVVGERTQVPELAGEPDVDLVLPNYQDLAYCKIRFDERSLQTLTRRLRGLGDPLSRTLCWNALWDMLRDAELPATRFAEIVLNNIEGETDIGVVQQLIGQVHRARSVFGAPDKRRTAREKLEAHARERMLAAARGSDVQLAWARAFIGAARSTEGLEFVRGLLDGSRELDGLVVDMELRWQIVRALAEAGAAGDELISAELERDPTDQGERYAAGARAARPSAEAKAEAWDQVAQDAEITLAMMRAVCGAFNDSEQDDLISAYVDRYFDEVVPFWQKRELDLGIAFARGMYPRTYTQDVVDKTAQLLAGEIPQPMRRLLLESKDETERAMRARAADR